MEIPDGTRHNCHPSLQFVEAVNVFPDTGIEGTVMRECERCGKLIGVRTAELVFLPEMAGDFMTVCEDCALDFAPRYKQVVEPEALPW